jgi:hypothetical protein
MKTSENMAEPGDLEVLTFYTEIGTELVGVAPSPDSPELVSIVGRDRMQNFFHLLFTAKEADMIIEALQELRRRRSKKADMPTCSK